MKDISRKITLKCSVCGNDQFSTLNEAIDSVDNAPMETEIRCSDCGRIATKEQILEENEGLIEANMEDVKQEAFEEIKKELKKMFK